MPEIPIPEEEAFNCPHCGTYAHQKRHRLSVGTPYQASSQIDNFSVTRCSKCHQYAIWHRTISIKSDGFGIPVTDDAWQMVYPLIGDAPLPNKDLPEDIKEVYLEARAILAQSPRGAAALLRLAIQKLCVHLGEPGKDLNSDIGSLVKKGLWPKTQKALDIVRLVGNDAVHPGQIDLNDRPETAKKLFALVNIIAQQMITDPKQVNKLFEELPETKKKQIAKRDSQSKNNKRSTPTAAGQ